MNKKIITISREFGSGGRTVGKRVADILGISYYDKELIEKVAEETGLDEKFIEEKGEHSPSTNKFSYSFIARPVSGMSVEDYLWSVQKRLILDIAGKESCVIVGRCADYILKDRKDCLNVFIHADINVRAERVINLYGETDKKIYERLKEKDKKRKINYKYYTDQTWGMADNYHVTLDSGVLGIEKCVDLIVGLVD